MHVMTGNEIPNDNHVVRYVRPSLVDGETVDGSAFILRPGENGLSVHWLEAVNGGDTYRQLDEVRRLSRLALSRNGRFAKLNVEDTKRRVSVNAKEAGVLESLGFIEAPLASTAEFEADCSHAEITGLPPGETDEAMLVGDLIVECIIRPLYPGKTK